MEMSTCSSDEVRSFLTPTTHIGKNNPLASTTSVVLARSSGCNRITLGLQHPQAIQFASPSVDKGFYQVITVDEDIKRLVSIADESREGTVLF